MVPLAGTHVLINGRQLSGNRIIVLGPDIDLHASTNSGAEVWSIHLPVSMLQDQVHVDGIATTVLEGQDTTLQAFREAIRCSLSVESERRLAHCESRFADLAAQLLSRESPNADLDYYHRRQKRQALARAVEFIEENIAGTTRIALVCRHAGVSRRTLERLFRREFQQTPSAYIRARRLNAVRQEFWRGFEGEETITDVAARYGFVHMGHFSSAYRRQFGVLPSEDRQAFRS
jgi:AraC-like DNA-binding protein